jgi:CBS domain-containing protein
LWWNKTEPPAATYIHGMTEELWNTPQLAAAMATQRVFALLKPADRLAMAAQWRIDRIAEGEEVVAAGTYGDDLWWLLDGQVELVDAEGEASLALGTGELFGCGQASGAMVAGWKVVATRSSLLAKVDEDTLAQWCERVPALRFHFPGATQAGRAQTATSSTDMHLSLVTRSVGTLVRRQPVQLPPTATIRAAAQAMSSQRVSSVLICEQDHLFGLITDRDLRNRVVAQGLDIDRPILDIATLAPLSINASAPAFHAMLLMARHNIHHVPVMDGNRAIGMITTSDLTEHYSTSAVYLARSIHTQESLEGLVEASGKVRQLQRSLAAAGATAYSSGHIMTAITDALTSRLLQLGEARLGPPPVDYCWVAAGSQARSEQTAKSDQDNCMILDDRYDEAAHGAYFASLSKFVCDGLDACGYVHCPGEMMAMTPNWRQPQRRWAEYFHRWVDEPEPKALMLTCVFFDLRAIYGRSELLEDLRRDVLARTQGNRIFLAYMVSNALGHTPPLGMFGQISTPRSGEHRGTIDLKHSGIVPIVDLARVYALAGGHAAVNTHDRLDVAAQGKEVSEQAAHDLRDALEFLCTLRIQHQARQIDRGQAPDNYLVPEELSNFERRQLKDAFVVVQKLQQVLSQRYTAGRF